MKFLLSALEQCKEYCDLYDAVRKKALPAAMWGVPDSLKASFTYALCQKTGKKAVVLVPEGELARAKNDLIAHFGEGVLVFKPRDYVFRRVESASATEEAERLEVLLRLISGDFNVVVTSADALMRYTIDKRKLVDLTVTITRGEDFPLEDAEFSLLNAGYTRCERVEGVGQFCIRGGILDFFPLLSENPVRIEYFGDEPDLIGEFDVFSQRRISQLECVKITPVAEVILDGDDKEALATSLEVDARVMEKKNKTAAQTLYSDAEAIRNTARLASIDKYIPYVFSEKATLLDYIEDCLLFSFEFARFFENVKGSAFRIDEDIKALAESDIPFVSGSYYLDVEGFKEKIGKKGIIIFENLSRNEGNLRLKSLFSINARQTPHWRGITDELCDDIYPLYKNKTKILVSASNPSHATYLRDCLEEKGINAVTSADVPETLSESYVYVVPFYFNAGYELPSCRLAIFSDNTEQRAQRKKLRPKNKYTEKSKEISSITDLKPGDYIVHNDYGIGVFEGLISRTVDGVTKDQLKIRYAGSDVLYIPCSRLDLISKYMGADVENIRLNKLGGNDFARTKSRVRAEVAEMAKELIQLYAQRMEIKGYAFCEDDDWQHGFENKFEYDETEDQLRCIAEIKRDMQRPQPMDRLLCGDVGVGKTEVALRAAFKAVADNKQVAILVPTTVLCWQHYQTVSKRMADYPIKVEMLSRFRTPKQQEKIVKQLKTGEVDIIIGTHRLLQKDIAFKDLGLVIVDEEQRFGVSHKEKLKELTKSVDALALSATPIPRTLNMALTGIRDMSVIEEPPQNRHPIQTFVAEQDLSLITDALAKELARGGQAYVLYNRIESIYKIASQIGESLPDARIAVAHGKMGEEEMSAIWESLVKGEIDILVCTTIIETGVDVPNVNTIVIYDADKLGLAQLHQIRGRVGRSSRRAYAYLMYKKGKVLSEDAAKRLLAIKEYTEFGSGLKIAMRDLEIRGAGNVLGAKQHGHMEAVGYDMYVSLLKEAIAIQKGEPIEEISCVIDINVSAYIPNDYIFSGEERIEFYKKISSIETEEDVEDILDELIDRYGEPPPCVLTLIKIATIKNAAAKLKITEIVQNGKVLVLYTDKPDLQAFSILSAQYRGRLMLSTAGKAYISLRLTPEDTVEQLEGFISKYSETKKNIEEKTE
ncbi:MAG: transcription-repair coupling factor [Ruminococcaceae bacterium]|nr:transcription-repair coupling factor [Oscillospiraceae bacterium]